MIFSRLFGGAFGRGGARFSARPTEGSRPRNGAYRHFSGCGIRVLKSRSLSAGMAKGRLKIKIPAGVDRGSKIRIAGRRPGRQAVPPAICS